MSDVAVKRGRGRPPLGEDKIVQVPVHMTIKKRDRLPKLETGSVDQGWLNRVIEAALIAEQR